MINHVPHGTDSSQTEAVQAGASPSIGVPYNTKTARIWLIWLNEAKDISWERLSKFVGVPPGTLWSIANGSSIPSKWKPRLGVYYNRDLYSMPVAELRWAIENRR